MSGDKSDFEEFKSLRNLTQRTIIKEKQNLIKNQIEENVNNPKGLWACLKSLGTSSKTKSNGRKIGLKDEDGKDIIFDEKIVANKFNTFFTNIAGNLVSKLPRRSKRKLDPNFIDNFYAEKGIEPNSFSFHITTEDDVLNY